MPSHARTATAHTRDLLASTFGCVPFTHAELTARGITRGQLRAALSQGYVDVVKRGLFTVRSEHQSETPADLARTALRSLGDVPGIVAGRIAGQIHDIPFIAPSRAGFQHELTEVLVLRDSMTHFGRKLPRVILRPVDVWPDDFLTVEGMPVTGLLHTAVDLVRMGLRPARTARAKSLSLPEALVVLDATCRSLGDLTPDDAAHRLAQVRPRFRQAQGIRAVDAAALYVDPRAESPLESWSRGYMVVYGLPMPLLQHTLIGADGMSYRVDFYWPDARLIGEADGLAKYGDDPKAFRRAKAEEVSRQRALEAEGLRFIRWTWDDIALRPALVMRDLAQALARGPRAA
ncbi:MAG: endonuclease domain-containing protein [Actinomycetota bacterium]